MQGIRYSLTSTINQEETTNIQVFTNKQATLKTLKDSKKYSAPQIMQDILKTQRKLISFHWILSHRDINANEEAEIAATKEATG